MRHSSYWSFLLAILLLVSCNRNPEIAKKKYLENGNRYFDSGRYREASIMYRNAIQKDPKFGEAYYRLALTEWKLGRIPNAIRPLERAVGLLDKQKPEYLDASLKLGEVYLMAASQAATPARQSQLVGEVERISSEFLKADTQSYEGHKLTADVAQMKAVEALGAGSKDSARQLLEQSAAEYRLALAAKPREVSVELSLARAISLLGQNAEAERLYRHVLDQDKANAIAYSELYRLYAAQNRAGDAESILKAAIQNNPARYDLRQSLASHYYASGKPAEMIQTIEELKSRAKEYERAYLTAGDFYLKIGRLDDAVREYKAGIEATPKVKLECEKHMMEALIHQGKRSEATQLNNQILKENPKDPEARTFAASQLLDSGQASKAFNELQNIVAANPQNFVARFQLGRAHASRGEWEQARQEFTATVRDKPNYLPARLSLAELQLSRGEYEPCLESTSQILRINPRNAPATLVQASALANLKRLDESRTVLAKLIQNNPNSAEGWFQLGSVNLSQKKYKDAEAAFQRSYALNPSKIRPLIGVAETYAAQDRLSEAIQALAVEHQKRPDRADLTMAMVSYQIRARDTNSALTTLQAELPKLDRKNKKTISEICFQTGEIYRQKGDIQKAIEWMRKAYEAAPDNFVITGNLALLLDSSGQKGEARKLYEQSLRKEPENAIVLNNLAFLLSQNGGDLDQALTLAQRAKQRMPESYEISDTLGMIYLKKNLTDSAIQIFRVLVKQQPNNALFKEHLSQALLQKEGKIAQASRPGA